MAFNGVVNIGSQKGNEQDHTHVLSPFGITINPNISSHPTDIHYKVINDKLLEVCEELFNNEKTFKSLIVYKDPKYSKLDKLDAWTKAKCEIQTANVSVEYGAQNKLHIQAAVHIKHNSIIMLDKNKMVKAVADKLQIPVANIYCHIQTVYGPRKTPIEKAALYPLKNRPTNA